MIFRKLTFCIAAALAIGTITPGRANAEDAIDPNSIGESIYVPAFTHVHTHKKYRQPLSSTLVVHNVDPTNSLTLQSMTFYNEAGEEVMSFLTEPVDLAPFQSRNFLTELSDNSGGVGANYFVTWDSPEPVHSPLVQAVMIGGSGTMGISFVTEGRVVRRTISPD